MLRCLSIFRRSFLPGLVLGALLHAAGAGADPLRLLDGSQRLYDPASRARLARDLSREISTALARIGEPSAAERDAVSAELASIDGLSDPEAVNVRAQRLYASPSFQHVRLANTLAAVHEALACAAGARGAVRHEMSCWAIAGTYLADRAVYDEALDVLARSGRLSASEGMTRRRWKLQGALWARYGTAIQKRITIPFLTGRLD